MSKPALKCGNNAAILSKTKLKNCFLFFYSCSFSWGGNLDFPKFFPPPKKKPVLQHQLQYLSEIRFVIFIERNTSFSARNTDYMDGLRWLKFTFSSSFFEKRKGMGKHYSLGAAIAQWIHLRLPSCRSRFDFQAHHPCLYHL